MQNWSELDLISFLKEEKVEDLRLYSNAEWLNIIVGTVRSSRHISGILKKIKCLKLISKENIFGANENGWVIISVLDWDIHLFSEEKRDYYGLDSLWREYELQK